MQCAKIFVRAIFSLLVKAFGSKRTLKMYILVYLRIKDLTFSTESVLLLNRFAFSENILLLVVFFELDFPFQIKKYNFVLFRSIFNIFWIDLAGLKFVTIHSP